MACGHAKCVVRSSQKKWESCGELLRSEKQVVWIINSETLISPESFKDVVLHFGKV